MRSLQLCLFFGPPFLQETTFDLKLEWNRVSVKGILNKCVDIFYTVFCDFQQCKNLAEKDRCYELAIMTRNYSYRKWNCGENTWFEADMQNDHENK